MSEETLKAPPLIGTRWQVKFDVGPLKTGMKVSFRIRFRKGSVRGYVFYDVESGEEFYLRQSDLKENFEWSDFLDPVDDFEVRGNQVIFNRRSSLKPPKIVTLPYDVTSVLRLESPQLVIVHCLGPQGSTPPIQAFDFDGNLVWSLPVQTDFEHWSSVDLDNQDRLEISSMVFSYYVDPFTGKVLGREQFK